MKPMSIPTMEQLLEYTQDIRQDLTKAFNDQNSPTGWEALGQAQAAIANLLHILGPHGAHWAKVLQEVDEQVEGRQGIMRLRGAVSAIIEAIENRLLVTVEGLVRAEVHSDLLEQAEHLASEGYHLAAGVLGRAVLEEHLRKWCEKAGHAPAKPKPTLSDYYGALYAAKAINKMDLKEVESLAAIGNEAAHNTGKAGRADIERLLRGVRDFTTRYPAM